MDAVNAQCEPRGEQICVPPTNSGGFRAGPHLCPAAHRAPIWTAQGIAEIVTLSCHGSCLRTCSSALVQGHLPSHCWGCCQPAPLRLQGSAHPARSPSSEHPEPPTRGLVQAATLSPCGPQRRQCEQALLVPCVPGSVDVTQCLTCSHATPCSRP